MLDTKIITELFKELTVNNVVIHHGSRQIRYAQNDQYGLAITDDNLINLIDLSSERSYFTIEVIDQKQSIVDLIHRAFSNCPGRDFFQYRNDTVLFYPNKV